MPLIIRQPRSNLQKDRLQFFIFLKHCGFGEFLSQLEHRGIQNDNVSRWSLRFFFHSLCLLGDLLQLISEFYVNTPGPKLSDLSDQAPQLRSK